MRRRWGHVAATLLAVCFVTAAQGRSADAEQRSIRLIGHDDLHKIVLTLTEYKPGIYSATGTLYLGAGEEAFPIQGTFYEKSGELKATAKNPEDDAPLIVDGYSVRSAAYETKIHVTVKDPGPDKIYFKNAIVSTSAPPTESAEPEGKTPAVEGKEPSPPGTREEWSGLWRGREKATHVMEGAAPQIREGAFEMQVVQDGSSVRLIGYGERGKETTLQLTPSNPNVAMMKKEWKTAIADGVGFNKEVLVIFLREGRLYLSQRLTMTIVVKKTTTQVTSDVIGIADRVKGTSPVPR